MRKLALFGMVLTFALFVAGCHKDAAKPSPAADSTSPWVMTLTTTPDQPVSDKDTRLHLKLTDRAGKVLPGAQVKASLIMPMMDMGKNEVQLADLGNGEYEGTGKFTMAGPWNVVVAAAAQGKTGEQTFSVVAREQ